MDKKECKKVRKSESVLKRFTRELLKNKRFAECWGVGFVIKGSKRKGYYTVLSVMCSKRDKSQIIEHYGTKYEGYEIHFRIMKRGPMFASI